MRSRSPSTAKMPLDPVRFGSSRCGLYFSLFKILVHSCRWSCFLLSLSLAHTHTYMLSLSVSLALSLSLSLSLRNSICVSHSLFVSVSIYLSIYLLFSLSFSLQFCQLVNSPDFDVTTSPYLLKCRILFKVVSDTPFRPDLSLNTFPGWS